jgi:hypothetical protein
MSGSRRRSSEAGGRAKEMCLGAPEREEDPGQGRPSLGALLGAKQRDPPVTTVSSCGVASRRRILSVPATARGIAALVCMTLCMAASGPQSAHPYYHPSPHVAPGGYGMAPQVRVPTASAPREAMGKIMPGSLAHLAMGLEEVRHASQREAAAEMGYVAASTSPDCGSPPLFPFALWQFGARPRPLMNCGKLKCACLQPSREEELVMVGHENFGLTPRLPGSAQGWGVSTPVARDTRA